jgi:hypothetical protein
VSIFLECAALFCWSQIEPDRLNDALNLPFATAKNDAQEKTFTRVEGSYYSARQQTERGNGKQVKNSKNGNQSGL